MRKGVGIAAEDDVDVARIAVDAHPFRRGVDPGMVAPVTRPDRADCSATEPYSLLERVNWTAWAACRSVGGMAISVGCAAMWACTMASALAVAPGSPLR